MIKILEQERKEYDQKSKEYFGKIKDTEKGRDCLTVKIYLTNLIAKIKEDQDDFFKKKAFEIIQVFEQLLRDYNIKIASSDREEKKGEACIYGDDYFKMEGDIAQILKEMTK